MNRRLFLSLSTPAKANPRVFRPRTLPSCRNLSHTATTRMSSGDKKDQILTAYKVSPGPLFCARTITSEGLTLERTSPTSPASSRLSPVVMSTWSRMPSSPSSKTGTRTESLTLLRSARPSKSFVSLRLMTCSTRVPASSRARLPSLLVVGLHEFEMVRAHESGDSGIGRSAAQMFAREGADVTIAYLPEEEEE